MSLSKSPDSKSAFSAPLTVIYTNIGRGHPNYLDSVLRCLRRGHPDTCEQIAVTSVFKIAEGMSLLGWKTVRRLYRLGSRGGVISHLYSRLRSRSTGYNSASLTMRLLARDLQAATGGYRGICLVAHPVLAQMLSDRNRVFYLHGEIAAPAESTCSGVERVYLPLPKTRSRMEELGVPPAAIRETGLVLEPEILAELDEVVQNRIARITGNTPLTVGFFISGAYPTEHVKLMLSAAADCHRAGMKVRLFWGCDQKQVARLSSRVQRFISPGNEIVVDSGKDTGPDENAVVIVTAATRELETVVSLKYLPQLDLFCAAPHERVNWAAGAGLPLLMIAPPIGSFAPENLRFVEEAECGLALAGEDAFANFADTLQTLRQRGDLASMVNRGFGKYPISGAERVAMDLVESVHVF